MKVVYGVFVALALMLAPAFADEAPACDPTQNLSALEEVLVAAGVEHVKIEGDVLAAFDKKWTEVTGNAKPEVITTIVFAFPEGAPFANVGFFKEDGCFYGMSRWPLPVVRGVLKEVTGAGI